MTFFENNADKNFIIRGGGKIPFEHAPMDKPPGLYSAKNVLTTGWHIYSTPYQAFLNKRKINNLLEEIIDDKNFVVVDPPKEELYKFVLEHYGKTIKFIPLELPPGYADLKALKNSFFIATN